MPVPADPELTAPRYFFYTYILLVYLIVIGAIGFFNTFIRKSLFTGKANKIFQFFILIFTGLIFSSLLTIPMSLAKA